MLTPEALTAAGFRHFCRHGPPHTWDTLFQKKIVDQYGIRYFINVYQWLYNQTVPGWEAEITYNDGCVFHPGRAALRVLVYAGVESWTPADIEAWAAQLWDRLCPNYYERQT